MKKIFRKTTKMFQCMLVVDNWMRKILGQTKALGFLLFLYEEYVPERSKVMLLVSKKFRVLHGICAIAFKKEENIQTPSRNTIQNSEFFLQLVKIIRKTIGTSSSFFKAAVKFLFQIKNPFFIFMHDLVSV